MKNLQIYKKEKNHQLNKTKLNISSFLIDLGKDRRNMMRSKIDNRFKKLKFKKKYKKNLKSKKRQSLEGTFYQLKKYSHLE